MAQEATYRTRDAALEAAQAQVFPRAANAGLEWGLDWEAATVYRTGRRYGVLLESQRDKLYRGTLGGAYSAIAHVYPSGQIYTYTGK